MSMPRTSRTTDIVRLTDERRSRLVAAHDAMNPRISLSELSKRCGHHQTWAAGVFGTRAERLKSISTTDLQILSRALNVSPEEIKGKVADRDTNPSPLTLSAHSISKSIGAVYLRSDSIKELLEYYSKEDPLTLKVGQSTYRLPFSTIIEAKKLGHLDDQPITFQFDDNLFSVPSSIEVYCSPIRERAKDWGYASGEVLRLDRMKASRRSAMVFLRPAIYYDGLGTNFSLDHKPLGAKATLRERLHPDARLSPFECDALVNHIGVLCLVESKEGQLVVAKRGLSVANRPGKWSCSVSGALKWIDVFYDQTKVSLSQLARGVFRETTEELNIRLENVRFLGAFREFLRGGKPELYFYARSTLKFSKIRELYDLRSGPTESTEIKGIEFRDPNGLKLGLGYRAKELIEQLGEDSDVPLRASILLAARLLEKEAGQIRP